MDYARIRGINSAFRRKSWERTTFAFERPQAHIDATSIGVIKSIPQDAREAIQKISEGGLVLFKAHLCLFSVHPKSKAASVNNAWVPSQEDLDADDWEVFEA